MLKRLLVSALLALPVVYLAALAVSSGILRAEKGIFEEVYERLAPVVPDDPNILAICGYRIDRTTEDREFDPSEWENRACETLDEREKCTLRCFSRGDPPPFGCRQLCGMEPRPKEFRTPERASAPTGMLLVQRTQPDPEPQGHSTEPAHDVRCHGSDAIECSSGG